jgi:hypothetical protein
MPQLLSGGRLCVNLKQSCSNGYLIRLWDAVSMKEK